MYYNDIDLLSIESLCCLQHKLSIDDLSLIKTE